MRRITLLVVVCIACFGMQAMAQQNALTSTLDSPIKMEARSYPANEVIVCTLQIDPAAALFGVDDPHGAGGGGGGGCMTNELFSPFRIFQFDQDCNPLSTWSTIGVVGTTVTGTAYPNGGGFVTYWAVDPFGGATITEYGVGTGVATGNVLPTPVGGSVWGGLVVDNNQPGEIMCLNEIALDSITCIDAAAGGTVICFYPNADNAGGGGAFGNGIADAVAPGDCSGQTLLNPSGTITEGQVVRAGQYDCTGSDPACTDRWDFAVTGSFFINGIAEISVGGSRDLLCADNVSSVILRLAQPVGIGDCQAIDADMDLVWINGSQGGGDFNVVVNSAAPFTEAVQKTGAGNGKFVYHAWAGLPTAATVSPLFDLGNQCFDFLGGGQVFIANNIGKTNLVGSSNYFGAPIPNPSKAPTFVLTQPVLDTANIPVGSTWTGQGIALNGAASSSKGGSLTNAVTFVIN